MHQMLQETRDVSAMVKHVHQVHVYIENTMEKQHSKMLKSVKNYSCMFFIKLLVILN